SAEIAAAAAAVVAAAAAVTRADWTLSQRSAAAPEAALVEDVLFRPGEEVAAGQAVVSLLPPDNVRLRFFLGPALIGRLTAGAPLTVACAGCPPGLAATVTVVAREASYAPPVIYSRDNKDKLVFLVEARPAAAAGLRPGEPVTVTLPSASK
ncbi:MAG: HlyD family secretion protein, partial [Magnetospirillum sp.]|nr:HlyD family secretion protein [Magnetospirillum sp.]